VQADRNRRLLSAKLSLDDANYLKRVLAPVSAMQADRPMINLIAIRASPADESKAHRS
jgi:hypothetical protein